MARYGGHAHAGWRQAALSAHPSASSAPQANQPRSSPMAMVWLDPAASAETRIRESAVTGVGSERLASSPCPRRPARPCPQEKTMPSRALNAREW
eukprot:scaffold128501_cov32-Tisochrysis_lutea.AAC.2